MPSPEVGRETAPVQVGKTEVEIAECAGNADLPDAQRHRLYRRGLVLELAQGRSGLELKRVDQLRQGSFPLAFVAPEDQRIKQSAAKRLKSEGPASPSAPIPEDQRQTSDKRSRGRPHGSSRYLDTDQAALEGIAHDLVREPDLLATAVIRRLGYSGESEISRLQTKWRKQKVELTAEAQRLLDAESGSTWLDDWVEFFSTVSKFVDEVVSPALRKVAASLERQARRRVAREELGIAPRSPIGADNVDRAIERFEARPHQTGEELVSDLPANMTVDEMPPSLRLYAMALTFHQRSLNAKEREDAASEALGEPGGDISSVKGSIWAKGTGA